MLANEVGVLLIAGGEAGIVVDRFVIQAFDKGLAQIKGVEGDHVCAKRCRQLWIAHPLGEGLAAHHRLGHQGPPLAMPDHLQ
ncbi:hypothetical protein D3C79_590020 [compost metagenome]